MTALMVVGTITTALGQMQAGKAVQKAANFEAAQMRTKAGQERATSQRVSAEERRRERIVQSNLQARAAGSGASAFDPTIIDLSGDLAEEGLYRANTALYEGEERARSLESGAALRQFEGKQAKRAGYFAAAGTALKGGNSLYDNYATQSPAPVEYR